MPIPTLELDCNADFGISSGIGEEISNWTDQAQALSLTGQTGQTSGSASKPELVLDSDGLRWVETRFGNTPNTDLPKGFFDIPAGFEVGDTRNHAVFAVVWPHHLMRYDQSLLQFGTFTSGIVRQMRTAYPGKLFCQTRTSTVPLYIPSQPVLIGVVSRAATCELHLNDSVELATILPAGSTTHGAGGKLFLCNTVEWWVGRLRRIVICSVAPSAGDVLDLKTMLYADHPEVITTAPTKRKIFIGDSRTLATNHLKDRNWPRYSRAAGDEVFNMGVGSSTLVDWNTNRATRHNLLHTASRTCEYHIHLGVNDKIGGASAATMHASLVTLCDNIRLDNSGAVIVVHTLPDHGVIIDEFNTLVRASNPGDRLIDSGANGDTDGGDRLGNGANTIYFNVDGLHTNDEGSDVIASHEHADATGCPLAPTFPVLGEVTATTAHINWQSNSAGNETGFKIQKRLAEPGSEWSQAGIVGSGIEEYTVTGLEPGTEYYLRVRSYNATADSNSFELVAIQTMEESKSGETMGSGLNLITDD
jgi:hypothetical protein